MTQKKKEFWRINLYWILPSIAILVFLVVILVSYTLFDEKSIWHHITRDVAISFLVAAIVGFMYETIARNRYDMENMEGVLTAAMGDLIGKDIWTEVESQILEKRKAREKVHITLTVEKSNVSEHQLILTVSFDYKLIGLRAKRIEGEQVTHFLDAHIKQGDLPKFEFIKVGDTVHFDEKNGISPNELISQGKFTCPVNLEPNGKAPIPVQTIRKEVVNFPGSYFLIMGDITKGLAVNLVTLPEDIDASINLRPHINNETPLEELKLLNYEHIMFLPGQGIEFRFKQKSNARENL